jgi:hypothetical protein
MPIPPELLSIITKFSQEAEKLGVPLSKMLEDRGVPASKIETLVGLLGKVEKTAPKLEEVVKLKAKKPLAQVAKDANIKVADTLNPNDYHMQNQKAILDDMSELGKWNKGASYRTIMQMGSEIFHQFSGQADYKVIKDRAARMKEMFSSGKAWDKEISGTYNYSVQNNKDKYTALSELWNAQPTTSPEQEVALRLNKKLLSGDFKGALTDLFEIDKTVPVEGKAVLQKPGEKPLDTIKRVSRPSKPRTIKEAAKIADEKVDVAKTETARANAEPERIVSSGIDVSKLISPETNSKAIALIKAGKGKQAKPLIIEDLSKMVNGRMAELRGAVPDKIKLLEPEVNKTIDTVRNIIKGNLTVTGDSSVAAASQQSAIDSLIDENLLKYMNLGRLVETGKATTKQINELDRVMSFLQEHFPPEGLTKIEDHLQSILDKERKKVIVVKNAKIAKPTAKPKIRITEYHNLILRGDATQGEKDIRLRDYITEESHKATIGELQKGKDINEVKKEFSKFLQGEHDSLERSYEVNKKTVSSDPYMQDNLHKQRDALRNYKSILSRINNRKLELVDTETPNAADISRAFQEERKKPGAQALVEGTKTKIAGQLTRTKFAVGTKFESVDNGMTYVGEINGHLVKMLKDRESGKFFPNIAGFGKPGQYIQYSKKGFRNLSDAINSAKSLINYKISQKLPEAQLEKKIKKLEWIKTREEEALAESIRKLPQVFNAVRVKKDVHVGKGTAAEIAAKIPTKDILEGDIQFGTYDGKSFYSDSPFVSLHDALDNMKRYPVGSPEYERYARPFREEYKKLGKMTDKASIEIFEREGVYDLRDEINKYERGIKGMKEEESPLLGAAYKQVERLKNQQLLKLRELMDVLGVKVPYTSKSFFAAAPLSLLMTNLQLSDAEGFDLDENGNLKFNASAALYLMGTAVAIYAGLAVSSRLFKYFTRAEFEKTVLAHNPAMKKLDDMVVRTGMKEHWADGLAWIGTLNEKLFNHIYNLKPFKKTYEAALAYSAHKDVTWLKFNKLKESLSELNRADPLAGDLFSNYVSAKRVMSRDRIDNPLGVDYATAAEAIRNIESTWQKRGHDVQQIRDGIDTINKWINDNMLMDSARGGLISQKRADNILKNNDFYAKFDVFSHVPENLDELPVGTSGELFSVTNRGIFKQATGTTKQLAVSPLDATIREFAKLQNLIARNKIANLLIEEPGMQDKLRRIASDPKEYQELVAKGIDVVPHNFNYNRTGWDKINRIKDGDLESYLVPEEIAKAMKTKTPRMFHKAIQKILSSTADVFRKGATSAYIPFSITNAMRDAMMAFNTSPLYKTGDIFEFAKDWFNGIREGFKYEFGSSDLVELYLNSGSGFGWSGQFHDLKRMGSKLLFESPYQYQAGILNPLKWFEDIQRITGAIELGPRLAIFEKALRMGYSAEQAALFARSATIDFSKGGTWFKMLNQWVPFINARAQAANITYEALRYDTKNTMTKIVSTVMTPAAGLFFWNRAYYSDLYDNIPPNIKDNYFMFIYGSEIDNKGREKALAFAMPKGDIGILWNPFEYALNLTAYNEPRYFANWMLDQADNVSPIGFVPTSGLSWKGSIERIAASLSPPIARAGLEYMLGVNTYTGRDVVPMAMKMKGTPPELQYNENTSPLYKMIGAKFGISPLVMQNVATNLFAAYGREGLDPKAMWEGITGRFLKRVGGYDEQRAWDEITTIKKEYQGWAAMAQELEKNDKSFQAETVMRTWNEKVRDRLSALTAINPNFEDQGRLEKEFTFSDKQIDNVLEPEESDLSPLMLRLGYK